MAITSFEGKHRFLSNFWACPIVFPSITFPSAENAYQACKTIEPSQWAQFTTCTAGQAKRLGRTVTLRPEWETMKVLCMHQILEIKFSNPELMQMLKDTGDEDLIEGNTWGDTYWGVCNGKGFNHLGQLLMIIRGRK